MEITGQERFSYALTAPLTVPIVAAAVTFLGVNPWCVSGPRVPSFLQRSPTASGVGAGTSRTVDSTARGLATACSPARQ